MTRKLTSIPNFKSYDEMRKLMDEDFAYRFENRNKETAFGRPLYERINVQLIITKACPFSCSFCLERQNPQGAKQNFKKQLESLEKILVEHPEARVSITGGEPALYPKQVEAIYNLAKNATFVSINTTGARDTFRHVPININISDNAEVKPDLEKWPEACVQTIFSNVDMTLTNFKKYINTHPNHQSFSFRYLTDISISDYNINILDEIKNDPQIKVKTFRVGDFFMYLTCEYRGRHFRVTLGDMKVQQDREYKGTYSNLIITPEGEIQPNWGNQK